VVLGFYSITVPPFPALEQSRLVGAEATMNFRFAGPEAKGLSDFEPCGRQFERESPLCVFGVSNRA